MDADPFDERISEKEQTEDDGSDIYNRDPYEPVVDTDSGDEKRIEYMEDGSMKYHIVPVKFERQSSEPEKDWREDKALQRNYNDDGEYFYDVIHGLSKKDKEKRELKEDEKKAFMKRKRFEEELEKKMSKR